MRKAKVRDVGARVLADGRCQFRVWAPRHQSLAIHLLGSPDRVISLEAEADGYFAAEIADVAPGTRYFVRFADGQERPDPASRLQPEGVHGPSAVVAPFTAWTDEHWPGQPLRDYAIYEIHTGTFTAEGTFTAIIPRLDDLVDLGITAIELMPIAQFPGARNWGYDGVSLYAAQSTYGGPEGLARLVDACHARGLAVILDVVYNHLGPEGNYLSGFGPYFTEKYQTPWGKSLNYDDAESDAVRGFFIGSALHWVEECHIDALRLDAVDTIIDYSAITFLTELAEHVHAAGERLHRHVLLIAESDLNDVRLIEPPERNGFGLDGQWCDNFHHALHTLLTGEQDGYYMDFGSIDDMARALRDGYVYTGDYSIFRRRSHGSASRHIQAERFVVFSQNHDQVGNRARGDRLSQLVPPEGLRLAAGVVLLSPYIPLIFMGEEYGDQHPFLFFINHGDPDLVRAVQEGRRNEFAAFFARGTAPDPADVATFQQSMPDPRVAHSGWHAGLRALYQELLRLRKSQPALAHLSKDDQEVIGFAGQNVITLRRWHLTDEMLAVFHFGTEPTEVRLPLPTGEWHTVLDSSDPRWGATPGAPSPLVPPTIFFESEMALPLLPRSFVLFARERNQ
ncbi:MAG: malto-oligosyltrehalose trehalohydrolase [Ktedonobacterales bacterium]|nr:malto-oligosyltrehalose trehalohydrolase [Ktedonobacterales bacterium]